MLPRRPGRKVEVGPALRPSGRRGSEEVLGVQPRRHALASGEPPRPAGPHRGRPGRARCRGVVGRRAKRLARWAGVPRRASSRGSAGGPAWSGASALRADIATDRPKRRRRRRGTRRSTAAPTATSLGLGGLQTPVALFVARRRLAHVTPRATVGGRHMATAPASRAAARAGPDRSARARASATRAGRRHGRPRLVVVVVAAHGAPGLPGDAQDERADRQADDRVGHRSAEAGEDGGRDDRQ